jgi:SWI/SNF-related matrix-associated actin-dependent regulator 1 of chromatin subfamily A
VQGLAKLVITCEGATWRAKGAYEVKDHLKAAGWRYDPETKCWWTDDYERCVAPLRDAAWFVDSLVGEAREAIGASEGVMVGGPVGPEIVWNAGRGRFEALRSYEVKDRLKTAGWLFDPETRCWWSEDVAVVLKTLETLSPDVFISDMNRQHLRERQAERSALLEASRANEVPEGFEVPVPEGLAYLPYQLAGIAYLAKRERVLLADEQGLGKTIQVLGLANLDPTINKALVVCPPSVVLVWRDEARRWLLWPRRVEVATAKEWPEEADWVIVHWAIVARYAERIRKTKWDLVVADEAHYAKNRKAQRTQALVGGGGLAPLTARRVLALSGTPIPNRPIELQTVARWLWPNAAWTKWVHWAKRYCGGYQGSWGWVVDGATHLNELQENLRAAGMLRRRKVDVLAELPEKIHRLVPLEANDEAARKALDEERQALASWEKGGDLDRARQAKEKAAEEGEEAYKEAVRALRSVEMAAFEAIAKARHMTALAKAPRVAEHVLDALETDPAHKVVLFAHHKDVITSLRGALEAAGHVCVAITGDTPVAERGKVVRRFQEDPEVRVFLGSIRAAAEGITLTAASHVIFAELDWTPGIMAQAEDRCHRIGQDRGVLVEHVVLDGSIDARIAKVLMSKAAVQQAALDDQIISELPPPALWQAVLGETHEGGWATSGNNQVCYKADTLWGSDPTAGTDEAGRTHVVMTEAQSDAAHRAMRYLAALDEDWAHRLNDRGFSKADAGLGHMLATADVLSGRQARMAVELARRYRRQLPEDLVEVLGF